MVHDKCVPLYIARRICKKAGAERVGKSAAEEMADTLKKIGVSIAKEAIDNALHSRRRTVKGIDIKIAVEKTTKELSIYKENVPNRPKTYKSYPFLGENKKPVS